MKKFLYVLLVTVLISSCAGNKKTNKSVTSLKDAFKNDFLIGTALNATQIEGKDAGAKKLVPNQFNAITPENVMKSENIHSAWNKYDFDLPDKFVNYGKEHGLYIVGHTLIWHSQLSSFAQRINAPDSLRKFMQEHIKTVAGRYGGKVNSWDVVNEALSEDGTMRSSTFYRKLGESYIIDAFRLTQMATPNSQLYYNDYNNEMPAKRAGCIRLIKMVKNAGVRIDGVGIQGHWHLGQIPFKEIEKSIEEYAALGVKVAITELDINVLPRPNNVSGAEVSQNYAADPKMNPYPNGLPESVQQQLANDYEELFKIFLKHKDKISRVTFWGVDDGQSWLNEWPIKGRTNYPLLFDRTFNPKPAYYKVIDLKSIK